MRAFYLSIATLAALAVSTTTADAQYRGRGAYRPSSSGVSSGGVSLSAITSRGVSLGSRSFDGNYIPEPPRTYSYYGYFGSYGGYYNPYYGGYTLPSPGVRSGSADSPGNR